MAALEEPHRGDRHQQPGQLGDLRHVRLHKQRCVVGIEAEGHQIEGRIADESAEPLGLADGRQGMEIGEKKVRLPRRLQLDVLADGAEVIPPVEAAGGLDPGKHPRRRLGAGGLRRCFVAHR